MAAGWDGWVGAIVSPLQQREGAERSEMNDECAAADGNRATTHVKGQRGREGWNPTCTYLGRQGPRSGSRPGSRSRSRPRSGHGELQDMSPATFSPCRPEPCSLRAQASVASLNTGRSSANTSSRGCASSIRQQSKRWHRNAHQAAAADRLPASHLQPSADAGRGQGSRPEFCRLET